MTQANTVWTKEMVIDLLVRNPLAVERAILVLFERQTRDEQTSELTLHHNNRGFMSCHSMRGSYYAKWLLSGNHLTGEHLDKARVMVLRYHRQLLEVIKQKMSQTV